MKTLFTLTFIACMGALIEQFAPKAKTPDNTNNDPQIAGTIMILQEVKIPDRSEVGFNPYPDSRVIQTTHIAQLGIPVIRLKSNDEMAKVVEFYKNDLSDWSYKNLFGTHMFWKGSEMEAMMGKIPNAQITTAEDYNKAWPDAQTIIVIFYEPQ